MSNLNVLIAMIVTSLSKGPDDAKPEGALAPVKVRAPSSVLLDDVYCRGERGGRTPPPSPRTVTRDRALEFPSPAPVPPPARRAPGAAVSLHSRKAATDHRGPLPDIVIPSGGRIEPWAGSQLAASGLTRTALGQVHRRSVFFRRSGLRLAYSHQSFEGDRISLAGLGN